MNNENEKYLIAGESSVHGFTVYEKFNSLEAASNELKNNKVYDEGETVFTVSILSATADYDEEIGSTVAISAEINNKLEEVSFTVQLCGTSYESQNGCWITTNGEDREFDENELLIFEAFDVINLAEKEAKRIDKETYKYHDTNFHCAINSCNLYARENLETGEITLVLIDISHNSDCDYGQAQEEKESFSDLDEAMDFLKQFRTEDYQDCKGLYAYINS